MSKEKCTKAIHELAYLSQIDVDVIFDGEPEDWPRNMEKVEAAFHVVGDFDETTQATIKPRLEQGILPYRRRLAGESDDEEFFVETETSLPDYMQALEEARDYFLKKLLGGS